MNEKLKGYLFCLLGVFSWSFSEIIGKSLQGRVGPVSLSFLRFFLAGFFLIFLLSPQRDFKDLKMVSKKYLGILLFASIVGLGISNILYFLGIHFEFTQANVASAIYTTYPIFATLFAMIWLHERNNIPLKVIGFLIGFLGTTILVTNFQLTSILNPEFIFGNILLVVAAAMFAIHSVVGKKIFRIEQEISNIEIKYNLITAFLACVPVFIVLVFIPDEFVSLFQYDSFEWALVVFLGFISTAFGLFIFFKGLKKIEVSQGMSLALLKPIIATIFAFLLLGEYPTDALIIAIILVSIGVLLINR
ncbi:MAG: DMT family transporter [Promethearchaeota archaeon]|nr:MAG: DMT family transporter [Candidatus Lokiarchaeota archaeon]